MKKALSLILAALLFASVLAGCSTLEKLENGDYDKGAIIDMYLTSEVYNFDPQQSMTDESMLKIMSLMFEGLTRIDENGKWQKAGMKNYKVDKDSEDGFSILVNLNFTRWSDGRTVQAADYVYAWKRMIEPDNHCEASALLYDIKNAYKIKMGDATVDDLGVAAVDTYTLEIEFEQKVDLDLFFENCSSIAMVPLREDVITRYGKDVWTKKSTSIVTNGPFTPKELVYGDTLRLERSSYYYMDPDKENEAPDKYVIPYRLLTKYKNGDASAQLDLLNAGKIFYDGELPLDQRANYAASAVVSDMLVTHTYVFNVKNPLFQKAEVRRALSAALDRTAIANIVTYAKPATGFLPPKTFDASAGTSFRSAGGDLISASADSGAKSQLSAAGVTSGAFTLTVRNNPTDLAIAEYVKGVWDGLGFNVTIKAVKPTVIPNPDGGAVTYADTFAEQYDAGEFDVIAIDATMLSTDAFQPLAQFAVPFSGNGVDMDSETYDLYGHVCGYADADYDALIESAFAEKDRSARSALLHQAEQKLLTDMPIVPLIYLQDAYLSSSVLSGIKTNYYGTREFKKTQLKDYMSYKLATESEAEAAQEAALGGGNTAG